MSILVQFFPFILFMGTLKAHQLQWLHWVLCTFIVVFGELILLTLLVSFITTGSLPTLAEIFTTQTIILYVAQLIFALGFFYYMEQQRDNSITSWFVAAFAGVFTLYVAIPFLIQLLI